MPKPTDKDPNLKIINNPGTSKEQWEQKDKATSKIEKKTDKDLKKSQKAFDSAYNTLDNTLTGSEKATSVFVNHGSVGSEKDKADVDKLMVGVRLESKSDKLKAKIEADSERKLQERFNNLSPKVTDTMMDQKFADVFGPKSSASALKAGLKTMRQNTQNEAQTDMARLDQKRSSLDAAYKELDKSMQPTPSPVTPTAQSVQPDYKAPAESPPDKKSAKGHANDSPEQPDKNKGNDNTKPKTVYEVGALGYLQRIQKTIDTVNKSAEQYANLAQVKPKNEKTSGLMGFLANYIQSAVIALFSRILGLSKNTGKIGHNNSGSLTDKTSTQPARSVDIPLREGPKFATVKAPTKTAPSKGSTQNDANETNSSRPSMK